MQTDYAIHFEPVTGAAPQGKITDAEIHFLAGALAGLKLIGFALWTRRTGDGINVTMPARAYTVNGERRSFALVRALADAGALDNLKNILIDEWNARERANRAPVSAPVTPAPQPVPVPAYPEPERYATPDDAAAAARAGKPIDLRDLMPAPRPRPVTPQAPALAGMTPLGMNRNPEPRATATPPAKTPGQMIMF